jgi:predicted metal-dependent hydrolase
MKRYMIYLKNQSHTPKDATNLLNSARSLLSNSKVIIRDTRVSNRRIEFDTSIPENDRIEEVVQRLSSIAPLSEYEHVVEKKMPKDEAIKYARSLFNFQKYWSAHEVLESIWKSSRGNEKDVLNGIILVAAAFVHDEKDEPDICISILKRAMKKLDKATGNYFEVDVDKLKDEVLRIIETGAIRRFGI